MTASYGYDLDADGESLLASIRVSPIAAVISDPRLPANPIVAVNDAFCRLTGYPVDEIIGRNCKFLAGPATEPWLTERISAGVRERRPVLVEILNYKRDRTPFRNAVLVAPVFDAEGALEYFSARRSNYRKTLSVRCRSAVGPLSVRCRSAVGAPCAGRRDRQDIVAAPARNPRADGGGTSQQADRVAPVAERKDRKNAPLAAVSKARHHQHRRCDQDRGRSRPLTTA